jgi:outer membrane immunogenic protein
MRRVLKSICCAFVFGVAASGASAADLPVKAPILKTPAVYNWSGFYVGLHAGGGWGSARWVDVTDPSFPEDEGTHNVSGWLAGGQLGFNIQQGAWVFGVELDASWTNIKGDKNSLVFPRDLDQTRVDSVGTIAARLGYAFDRTLFYVKGGAAWARNKYSIVDIPTGINYANFNQNRWGWMVGAGLEYGLAPNWSLKLEYNYLDLGTGRSDNVGCNPNPGFLFCDPPGMFNQDVTQRLHLAKLGINYRFGGWR